MTDPIAFSLAVLALLATPGPTNTLLAASGASVGVRASLRLMPAELFAYLLSILALVVALGPAIAAHPGLATGLKLIAGGWLVVAAARLWREAGDHFTATATPITPARVFVTTLLNPKALIFALVIFPHAPPAALLAATAAFSVLVLAVATGWIGFGAALAKSGGALVTPRRVTRIAAVVLAVFASLLAGSAVAGAL